MDDETFAFSLLGVFWLAGIAIFGYQVVVYLSDAVWYPISVITGLAYFDVAWAIQPGAWFGLHKVLDLVPLSVAVAFVGWVLAMGAM